MLELTQTSWILAIIGAFAVGLSKGGLAMVGATAVPLMSLGMSPVVAAGVPLPVYILSDIGGLIAFRRSFDRRVLATVLPGAMAGIVLGWATAHLVNEGAIMLVIGLIGLSFALNALIRPALGTARGPSWPKGSFWGAVAGYTSFVSHSGAPPYQVYVQPLQLPPAIYAGTTTICFAIINAVKVVPYAMLGQLNPTNLKLSLLLAIPAVVGVVVGVRLVRVIPQKAFYALITWLLLLISLRLIWTGAAGFLN